MGNGPRKSTVLSVDTDPGTASIVGIDGPRGRVFQVEIIDPDWSVIEDVDTVEPSRFPQRHTFEEALSDLEQLPWRRLRADHVAPEYAEKIWALVSGSRGRVRARWKELCHRPPCPQCGERSKVVEVIYGVPSKELFLRAEAGEVALGGCVVWGAKWCCNGCGIAFENAI
jgi:hypothetical protein